MVYRLSSIVLSKVCVTPEVLVNTIPLIPKVMSVLKVALALVA